MYIDKPISLIHFGSVRCVIRWMTVWPTGSAADDWSELGGWEDGSAPAGDSSAAWQQAEDSWLGGALDEEEPEQAEPWPAEVVSQEAEVDIMSGRQLTGAQVSFPAHACMQLQSCVASHA
jgi:hypothetical protein